MPSMAINLCLRKIRGKACTVENKKLPFIAFLLLCLSCGLHSYAQQDPTQVFENKLEVYLMRLDYLRRDTSSKIKQDSLLIVNTQMMAYLKKACIHQPALLQDEVRPADSAGVPGPGINIVTSDDNKLRIFCWDTWTGSNQHHFNALAQFAAGNNTTRIKVFNDIAGSEENTERGGTWFTDICTLHTMLGKTIYLVLDHKVFGSKGGTHAIHAYTIDKGSLIPVPIFKTNGKLQNTVVVEHDMAPYGEWAEDDAYIKLSDDRRTMFVPLLKKEQPSRPGKDSLDNAKKPVVVAVPTEAEAAARDYYIYRFDGFHYVYDKEANKSLK